MQGGGWDGLGGIHQNYTPEKPDSAACAAVGLVFKDQLAFYRLRTARPQAQRSTTRRGFLCQRFARAQKLLRILRHASHPHFKMQMRAGGAPR